MIHCPVCGKAPLQVLRTGGLKGWQRTSCSCHRLLVKRHFDRFTVLFYIQDGPTRNRMKLTSDEDGTVFYLGPKDEPVVVYGKDEVEDMALALVHRAMATAAKDVLES